MGNPVEKIFINFTRNFRYALKISLIILTLAAIFLQAFSQDLIWVQFTLHRSYISRELCIHRDQPRMHCNGSCFLKKKLEEAQDHEGSKTVKLKWEMQLFSPASPTETGSTLSLATGYPQWDENLAAGTHPGILHPPMA